MENITNLQSFFIFFIILVFIFWIMSEKKQKQVTGGINSLGKILPMAKILEYLTQKIEEGKKKKINEEDS